MGKKIMVDQDDFEGVVKDLATEMKGYVDRINDRVDGLDARAQKGEMVRGARGAAVEGKGPFLGLEQKVARHFDDDTDYGFDPSQVRLGALLAGYGNYGKVKDQLNAEEHKALSALIGPQGDLLIPTVIGREWLDAIRPKTQVLAAGGRTYPMEARNVILPGWDVPPKAGWRGDKGSFADGSGSFRAVELDARDIGAFTDVPNSLFEDAAGNIGPVSDLVEAQLSKAIAQGIDLAALLSQDALNPGGGTQVPQGLAAVNSDTSVSANYGIAQATSSGTNGGTPSNYDWLIDAAATVAGANFTPTAHLGSSRTFATLGKLKDGQQRYLDRPQYLDGVGDYPTNQIGSAYKKGTSTDTSVSFVGDFSNLLVGMRGDLAVLRDPYTQGLTRTTRLIVSMRADVAVLNKGAFVILDGLRP